jgi:ribosomal protein S18 acetylase RimI-like enzyme
MMSIKTFKDFLYENIKFNYVDSGIPHLKSYDIMWEDKKIGTIDFGLLDKKLETDEMEILLLSIDPEFRRMNLNYGKKSIETIWKQFPYVNRIFLQSTKEAEEFWKKIGAVPSKIKENYLEIQRPV